MVGCSAVGCSNRTEQGYVLKVFPKNPQRRREWAAKVRRENWTPTDRSYLCEVHFEPEMWEKIREDGSRKLKWNAVPTLFSFVEEKPKRKSPMLRKVLPIKRTQTRGVLHEPEPTTSVQLSSSDSDNVIVPAISAQEQEYMEREQLSLKMKQYEVSYNKLTRKLRMCRNKLRNMRKSKKSHIPEEDGSGLKYDSTMRKVFNQDQIIALQRKSTKFSKWSNATIMNALKLRFSCGVTGYEELLRQKIPLPSLRTLRRRLENIHFTSGVLDEVFSFLESKVKYFKDDHEKDCVIVIDEMAIYPSRTYDTTTKTYLGDVTLPGHTGVATHAAVIMIGGITTRWKQTIAYYFTGDSVKGSVYEEILFEVIEKTENLGLKVVSITSDMGASNQALWKHWSVTSGRHSKMNNFIPHPFDESRKIYILADVPHLFKNIKNMLVTNEIIEISPDVQSKFNLPTNIINVKHIEDLIQYQSQLKFKLAPKLSEEDLTPTHFQKMRVSTSTNVISHDVSSGLKFISEELNKPEYLTTAWFLDTVEKWFSLMTSRHPVMALSKINLSIYEDSIDFLQNIMIIFEKMKVGAKHAWKPSQTGLLISTQSILDIQKFLFDEKNYVFILTSRFTQDCLENLFSILRSKQSMPNAVQFKNHLKLVSVSQFLKDISKGSYAKDDREFLADFLIVTEKPHTNIIDVVLEKSDEKPLNLNNSEQNSLYRIAGYLISSIKKTSKVCVKCLNSVGSKRKLDLPYSKLVKLRAFKENTLYYCNEETFVFFVKLEEIFRQFFDCVYNQNFDLKKFFVEKMSENCVNISHIPACHNLKMKIIHRYTVFRLKIASKKVIGRSKVYSSKTAMSTSL